MTMVSIYFHTFIFISHTETELQTSFSWSRRVKCRHDDNCFYSYKKQLNNQSIRIWLLTKIVSRTLPQTAIFVDFKCSVRSYLIDMSPSTGEVRASSHALWRVLSNTLIWVFGNCWVDTPHIHTSEWHFLFLQICLLSTVMVTPSDSEYVNRSASIQRRSLIHTTLNWNSWVPRGTYTPSSRHTR